MTIIYSNFSATLICCCHFISQRQPIASGQQCHFLPTLPNGSVQDIKYACTYMWEEGENGYKHFLHCRNTRASLQLWLAHWQSSAPQMSLALVLNDTKHRFSINEVTNVREKRSDQWRKTQVFLLIWWNQCSCSFKFPKSESNTVNMLPYALHQGSPWQNRSAWVRLFGKLLSFMHTLSLIKRPLLNRSKELMTVLCIYRSLVQEHPGGNPFKWAWGIVFHFPGDYTSLPVETVSCFRCPHSSVFLWWANLGKICYGPQEKLILLTRWRI